MRKKHILEFSTYAKIGGTQQMLLEFLRHASHDTFTYYLCVLLEHDVLNEKVSQLPIEHTSLNMRGYWDLSAWWKLYTFIQGKQIDLIRTYGLKADIIGRIVGRIAGIPVHITSVRSTDPWRKWYHVMLDSLTARFTDLYVSNSEAGRMAVHQRERIPLTRIVTIPNGIAPDLLLRSSQRTAYRQQFGISATTPVLGIVANLCKMKGHTTLLDALPLIQKKFHDIRCFFVGNDFLDGAIHRYVQEKHCEETVVFTGFRQDIPELLSLFDIVLLPSLWEGSPVALLEAMAMKKPIVATEVGGIPELVIPQKTGILIPPQNPCALADAVIFLLENPAIASRMGEAGYERVLQEFSLDVLVARTEALYERLIYEKTALGQETSVIVSS